MPGVEDEAFGAVFAVLAEFVVFEDAEGFVDAAGATDVFGVEDVAHIFGVESVEVADDGIELCLEDGAAVGVEDEGLLFLRAAGVPASVRLSIHQTVPGPSHQGRD